MVAFGSPACLSFPEALAAAVQILHLNLSHGLSGAFEDVAQIFADSKGVELELARSIVLMAVFQYADVLELRTAARRKLKEEFDELNIEGLFERLECGRRR